VDAPTPPPPLPAPAPTQAKLEGEEPDPYLHPPGQPPAGWFVEGLTIIQKPHLKDVVTNTVIINNVTIGPIQLPRADYAWTASPQMTVGYHLPRGMGDLLVAYRSLATDGSMDVNGGTVLVHLHSRLDLNQLDFDYANREFPPASWWDMRWRVGLRLVNMFFDTHASQPAVDLVLGPGLLQQNSSNYLEGAGPHAGLELARRFGDESLALYGMLDWSSIWDHLHQEVGQAFTVTPTTGVAGSNTARTTQGVGILQSQAGLRWQPPDCHNAAIFLGYNFEMWLQVGRNDNVGSKATFYSHGIFLRAEWDF
jgi:hypothetical protein